MSLTKDVTRIILRRGSSTDFTNELADTGITQYEGEPKWNTDTDQLYVNDGTNNLRVPTEKSSSGGIDLNKVILAAGTATAGTAPLKFTNGTELTTPEAGVINYHDSKFCVTNVATCRVIDRTSDVAVETVTVANTTDETELWCGAMPANSLKAGNMFKFHADGVVSNGGSASADDQIKIRVKIGGVTKVTLEPSTKALDGDYWHIDANACQRTIGETGSRAIHIHLQIDDIETKLTTIAEVDTTANMDVTVTAEWGSAKEANTVSLYQAYMEYKN